MNHSMVNSHCRDFFYSYKGQMLKLFQTKIKHSGMILLKNESDFAHPVLREDVMPLYIKEVNA